MVGDLLRYLNSRRVGTRRPTSHIQSPFFLTKFVFPNLIARRYCIVTLYFDGSLSHSYIPIILESFLRASIALEAN